MILDVSKDTIELFGIKFFKMKEEHYRAYAAAAPNSFISYSDYKTFIFEPEGEASGIPTLVEIVYDENYNAIEERVWQLVYELKHDA